MQEIKNYKIKNFLRQSPELIAEYVQILGFINPIQTNKEVYHLSLRKVEFIKENLNNSTDDSLLEIMAMVQGYEDKKIIKKLPKFIVNLFQLSAKSKVLNLRIVDFFGLLNSVKEQISDINNAESSALVSTHTNIKWEQVGGSDRLQKFGIYNSLYSLSDGDILKWEQIMELPYSEIFIKLLMDKENGDLQIEMQNIQTVKNV